MPNSKYTSQSQGFGVAKKMIQYNSNSNFDKYKEFIDVYLPYNKINIQLLANNSTTYSKKRQENKSEDNTHGAF